MSDEPKTLTPEPATLQGLIVTLGVHGYSLAFQEGRWWAVPPQDAPYEWSDGDTPWEAASKALGVRVVARDEAAEAKPIGWDDVADEDMMAALVKAQTEANVLKRAVREWVAADAAYSEWMVLPVREDWTSGEAKARKERLEVAEAELRRLAGGGES